MKFKLLGRDEFRAAVFARDKNKCVMCRKPAVDAHHILERKLWPDGGYYLENGASLCSECHVCAEGTSISCENIREHAGIKQFPVPPQLSSKLKYDKWGNQILINGMRLKGELFNDHGVQMALAPSVLSLFMEWVKHPRTYHLPWSPGVGKDDRVLESLRAFKGKEIVVTVKMDGENTTFYPTYMHARSVVYRPHPSRTWVKALQAEIGANIPQGWRVCGENMYAKHSILYKNLADYFLMFSIWNNYNQCLSWDDTVEWANLLGLKTVPVFYRGVWNEDWFRSDFLRQYEGDQCEGYVVRVTDSFNYGQYRTHVGKYVRENHVQTDDHWMYGSLERNGLRKVE